MKNIAEIGLSVLTRLKKITGNSVRYNSSLSKSISGLSHELWSELLKKNVSSEGKVNYKGFVQDKQILLEYTAYLSNNSPSDSWSRDEQLVYWINAYNAFTVLLIVNHYPVKSIKDIGGNIPLINSVWDLKFFKIGSVDFDLNTIEHEILRKKYDEPRIHFAINCASESCPKLRNKAYVEDELENQLESQTIDFINNSRFNLLSRNKVKLSKIFNWFASDFKKTQTIVEFISRYSKTKFVEPIEIDYLEYDWSLNDAQD